MPAVDYTICSLDEKVIFIHKLLHPPPLVPAEVGAAIHYDCGLLVQILKWHTVTCCVGIVIVAVRRSGPVVVVVVL